MIYFIQAGGQRGPIKIGYAGSVRAIHARLGLFQTAHMEPLSLLGFVEGDKRVEREYHAMFAADRLRGEWFARSGRLWNVATDAAVARDALDFFQTRARWSEWGLFSPRGELMEWGVEYLYMCERQLAEQGYDLEQYAKGIAGWCLERKAA